MIMRKDRFIQPWEKARFKKDKNIWIYSLKTNEVWIFENGSCVVVRKLRVIGKVDWEDGQELCQGQDFIRHLNFVSSIKTKWKYNLSKHSVDEQPTMEDPESFAPPSYKKAYRKHIASLRSIPVQEVIIKKSDWKDGEDVTGKFQFRC